MKETVVVIIIAAAIFLLVGGLFLYETSSDAWRRAYDRIKK